MVNVGIDWSQEFVDVCFLTGEQILSEKRFEVNASGMNSLLREIRTWEKEYGKVAVGIETDKHILCSFLLNHNISVSVVDPFSLSRFKEIYSASGRKDDRHDAYCIALMMQKNGGKITPINKSSAEYEQLRALLRIRERTGRQRTRSIIMMRAVLTQFFPAFSACFEKFSDSALQLQRLFPNPQEMLSMSEEKFLEGTATIKRFRAERRKEIFSYFQKHIPDFRVEHTDIYALEVGMLLDQIQILDQNLDTLDRKIQEIYTALPVYQIISSLPGCSDSRSIGPMMVAELGDNREKFKNHRAFQSFVGTSPVTTGAAAKSRIWL